MKNKEHQASQGGSSAGSIREQGRGHARGRAGNGYQLGDLPRQPYGDKWPMSKNLPAVGEVFRFPYPFSRDTYEAIDVDVDGVSSTTVPTWKVGPKNEYVYPDDTESVADAMGECVITVVSVHQPGRYPTRVFYTRTWVTPDGKAFGKTKLRVIAASAFMGWAQGYRHEFTLRGCKCDGCRSYSDHRVGDSRAIAYGSATSADAVDPQGERVTE